MPNLRRITETNMLNICKEVTDEAMRLNLIKQEDVHIPLYWSTGKRTLGTYHWDRYERYIKLTKYLALDTNQFRKTFVHEYAHYLNNIRNKGKGHDYNWYVLANKLGEKWGYKIERLENIQGNENINEACKQALKRPRKTAETAKYIVECPICGHKWYYNRMCDTVKYPHVYTHTKDGGQLTRVQ